MIKLEPLTAQAFAPYGQVVEAGGTASASINQGFAQRFNDLANIDVNLQGGEPTVAIFNAIPRPLPIEIKLMERHPLGSQMFYPLRNDPWLVLVCSDPQKPETFRAFRATGTQGINYTRNIWHHPLLTLSENRFLILERKGSGINLEEEWLKTPMNVAI
jgi:ureidoglycolate lyase